MSKESELEATRIVIETGCYTSERQAEEVVRRITEALDKAWAQGFSDGRMQQTLDYVKRSSD